MGMLQHLVVLSAENGVVEIGFLDDIDAGKAQEIEELQHRYFFDVNDLEFEKSIDRAMAIMLNKLEQEFLPEGEVSPEAFAEMFAKIQQALQDPATRDVILKQAGEFFKSAILARIRSGQTVDGGPLLDGSGSPGSPGRYTAGYEAYKKAIGRHPYEARDRLVLGVTPQSKAKKEQKRIEEKWNRQLQKHSQRTTKITKAPKTGRRGF